MHTPIQEPIWWDFSRATINFGLNAVPDAINNLYWSQQQLRWVNTVRIHNSTLSHSCSPTTFQVTACKLQLLYRPWMLNY